MSVETRVPEEEALQIDTSKMSEGKRQALEVTEAARDVPGEPLRQHRGAPVGASKHWGAATVEALWDRGAKEALFPPPGAGRNLRLRAHRGGCRVRPGQDDDSWGAKPRWKALPLERREALVHQRHQGRPFRGHGPNPAKGRAGEGAEPDHRLHR